MDRYDQQPVRKLGCQHYRLNRHAGKAQNGPPNLQKQGYKPRELFNRVMTSAYRPEWTASQRQAVSGFVELYLQHRQDKDPPTKDLMWTFIKYLDHFFFEGLLTQVGPAQVDLIVCQFDLFGEHLGCFRYRSEATGLIGEIEIHTHACQGGWLDQRTLEDIIDTLVHEMAHGYLSIFSCRGQECTRNNHNTLGVTGHGQVWVSLAAVMYKSIQCWHPQLRGVFQMTRHGRTVWEEFRQDERRSAPHSSPRNPFRTVPRGRQLAHIKDEGLRFREGGQEAQGWHGTQVLGRGGSSLLAPERRPLHAAEYGQSI